MKNTLTELPTIVDKRKKRVGRGAGSGKGAKSGRGTTRHQAAREDIPLHFEGGQGRLVKRFPLLRGKGKNKSLAPRTVIINLEALDIFKEGQTVNKESLIAHGLLSEKDSVKPVKILGKGNISKKLTVSVPVSGSVKKLIEKAGGEVIKS